MTLSEFCRLNGFSKVKEVEKILNMSHSTLYDWFHNDIEVMKELMVFANKMRLDKALLENFKSGIYKKNALRSPILRSVK